MIEQDFWEIFKDTGDPMGYLLYRRAEIQRSDIQAGLEQAVQSTTDQRQTQA